MIDADIARTPTQYLRAPWLKKRTSNVLRKKYRISVFDQPGRWMSDARVARLDATLRGIAEASMDAVPTYGVFTGTREAFTNRVVAVVRLNQTDEPVAFTAMVYLPILLQGRVEPVIHFGLTMIKKPYRGQRIQGPLIEKIIYSPFINQLRRRFLVTNIAASPAGIGSVADYTEDAYPHYLGTTVRKPYHLAVAEKVLRHYRHEFGCAASAVFEPQTFVVRGSNDREKGGAWQFISEDPVSHHKREECNDFCWRHLRFDQGDELFQVANVDLVSGTVGVLLRLGSRKRAALRAGSSTVSAARGN